MNAKQSQRQFNSHLIDVCEHIVRSVVSEPDLVEITLDDRREQLKISVSPADRGVVIGRGGQNLAAIESVLLLAMRYMGDENRVLPRLSDLPSLEVRAIDEA